jgi:exosortase/archaeosortase family protein
VNPALALLALALACWHGWRELAARLASPADAAPLALVLGALALPLMARGASSRLVPLPPLTLLLLVYALAVLVAPPLFCMAPALLALGYSLHAAAREGAPPAPFWGLLLLALPVLPTLEFYAAYPVRLAAIEATASLLRMNGLAVSVEGLALRFGEQLVQFDAPCSGVRMLWTCWFLASALAWLYRFGAMRYATALLVATLLSVIGNVLRATSLFHLEAGLLRFEQWPWMHDAVGLAAFVMTALLLVAVLRPRRPASVAREMPA